jgi:hypothetical protein
MGRAPLETHVNYERLKYRSEIMQIRPVVVLIYVN